MAVEVVNVSSLKKIKNNVIGNPSAKLRLAQDEVFIQTLVECLDRQPQDDDTRIEAAHVISSISYGSQEALRSLLRADALQAFLYAISNFRPSDSMALKAAFARALRALAVAISDAVGPSVWGLRSGKSDVRYEAMTALDCLFQLEYLDIYLPLLIDASTQTSTSIAQLLASAIRTAEHRSIVGDWLPSPDRIKEVKGKRGWEKPDTTNGKAPGRLGGWVARNLVDLLKSKDIKLQEAALSALASLSKDNPSVSSVLARTSPDCDFPPPLATIMSLCKTRSADVQLASSLCATHIIRSANNHSVIDPSWVPGIMDVVNRMIASQSESAQNRTKACFILTFLVSDDPAICQIANDRRSLEKLATLAKSITPLSDGIPSQTPWETEDDEPESTSALREAALRTIAALCLFEHEPRHKVSDTLLLIPIIHSSLSHTHVGVRFAAIQCVRMLSRAVAVLRTNIIDSGLGMKVFEIFKKEGEERNCVGASLATMCNIVVDASPLRPKFIEESGVARLVQLLNTDEPEFRLSSMWALKNLLCKTTSELKRKIMDQLGWSELAGLLSDPDEKIQEQAFCVVRNLAENESDIEMVFQEIGDSVLLSSLVSGLESTNEDVVLQAAYALANISNGYDTYQERIIFHPQLLNSLRACMADAKVEVRLPAVNCVFQLIQSNLKWIRQFHESGIVSTLRHISERIGAVSLSPGGVGRVLHGHYHHGADDDKEISERARLAVDWLEHVSWD